MDCSYQFAIWHKLTYMKIKILEYRIVKIEKGLFLIEYKTAPFGVWHEVKDKKFKTKPKAEAWAWKNFDTIK